VFYRGNHLAGGIGRGHSPGPAAPAAPTPERRLSQRSDAESPKGDSPQVIPFPTAPSTPQISFDRHELRTIFNLYGRRVAEGEWRDYAMDFRRDKAVFSIYRRTSEMPLYRIEKDPKLARKQGAYAVVAATGLVMKRGTDLARVLAVLETPLRAV